MADLKQIEISCQEVWREVSNYLDGVVDAALRERIERHLEHCNHCTAIVDGSANTVRLLGDDFSYKLPAGFSQRLQQRLASSAISSKPATIPFGITDDAVPLGSHVVHFWKSDDDFNRGVRFLEIGLAENDFGVLFGHEEANERVLGALAAAGLNVNQLVETARLTVLTRELTAQETLAVITRAFEAAVRQGACAIRYLGNLGRGKKELPGSGEADVLELEARVTSLARRFPCVVVCMYDVRALPETLVTKGGYQTHPWHVCEHKLEPNSHYIPEEQFLAALHGA